jgi:hypothetical protein
MHVDTHPIPFLSRGVIRERRGGGTKFQLIATTNTASTDIVIVSRRVLRNNGWLKTERGNTPRPARTPTNAPSCAIGGKPGDRQKIPKIPLFSLTI